MAIEESVKAVIEGQTISSWLSGNISKLLIYCSNYDPKTKTYEIDYGAIFFTFVNGMLVFATIIYLLRHNIKRLLFKGRETG